MTLYISNYKINNIKPLQKRISTIEWFDKRIWTIGLEPCDSFIIDSYDFNKFVFFVDYKDLDKVWLIPSLKKQYIVVKDCDDQIDALYRIGTDINIHIKCFFSDTIEDVLDEIL